MLISVNRVTVFILILFCSCAPLEKNRVDGYSLIQKSKVVLDEADLAHKSTPVSLQLINDTILAGISDYTTFAAYHIETGSLLKQIKLSDLLQSQAAYKVIDDFIAHELQPYYDDRKYMTDNLEEIATPRVRVDRILSATCIDTDIVVSLLVDIALRYAQNKMIDGKMRQAIVYDYLPHVIHLRLSDDVVTEIQPIQAHLINDGRKGNTLYIQTQLGGVLTKEHTLILPLTSDLNNFTVSEELIAFDLTDKQAKPYTFNQQYPAEMAGNPIKWLPRKYFYLSDDGSLYYNSLFAIYEIKGKIAEPVLSLDTLLNKANYERIGAFTKMKNGLFLMKIIGIDTTDQESYGKYVFYSPDDNQISASVLDFLPKKESQEFLLNKNRIIFISRDSENFYIEQFDITQK